MREGSVEPQATTWGGADAWRRPLLICALSRLADGRPDSLPPHHLYYCSCRPLSRFVAPCFFCYAGRRLASIVFTPRGLEGPAGWLGACFIFFRTLHSRELSEGLLISPASSAAHCWPGYMGFVSTNHCN